MEESAKFSQEVIDYIIKNENVDPYTIALKKSPFDDVDMKVIARQILGMKIAKRKFPFLLENKQYRYPKKESLEQASSEQTALFKSKLMSGDSFVDLTGGMGIDTYLLGRNFQSCTYVEPNQELYNSTRSNFKHLGFDHCTTINATCEDFLSTNDKEYDWAYIDPSRRINGDRKTSINNYEPNLVELQTKISDIADNIMVKLSPMQDISECVRELDNVQNIWVVSLQNEVKELLLHIKKDGDLPCQISAVDINKKGEVEFSHPFEDRLCPIKTGKVKQYLYQPNAAIVKAELQDRYAMQLGLDKLHINTQLYTSSHEVENFTGRVFKVRERINLNRREIKKALPDMKANVITKNFPLKPHELIQKYKLKDGGDDYLIAFTDFEGEKVVAVCERVRSLNKT